MFVNFLHTHGRDRRSKKGKREREGKEYRRKVLAKIHGNNNSIKCMLFLSLFLAFLSCSFVSFPLLILLFIIIIFFFLFGRSLFSLFFFLALFVHHTSGLMITTHERKLILWNIKDVEEEGEKVKTLCCFSFLGFLSFFFFFMFFLVCFTDMFFRLSLSLSFLRTASADNSIWTFD